MQKIISIAFVFAVALGASLAASAQEAEAPKPQFKRLKAPVRGTAPNIDVQIDPEEYFAYFNPPPRPSAESIAQADSEEGPDAKKLPFATFWRDYKAKGQPASLREIMDIARNEPAEDPRLAHLQAIADRYGNEILLASIETNVSPAFALAVIYTESAGKADAVSSAGAQGLMQLIPATAERFGVKDSTDPAQNIMGGMSYLKWLLAEFNGNAVHVLAAYNAGENAVKRNGGAPPYPETRAYVPKVLAAWNVARGLCLTPPELVTDGCVFRKRKVKSDG